MTTRVETVTVSDGTFDLSVWLPEATTPRPGILLVQEIFGVGDYISAVAADLAALGYVVAAPDLFWRQHRNWAADHGEEGLKASMELVGKHDFPGGITDSLAALEVLRGLPEVSGRPVGALGFCFGGTVTFFLAAQGDPDAVVSFYGSGVPDNAGLLADISAPILIHFGGADPYIPRAEVAKVEAAAQGRANVELHVQEQAGHAFHNRKAPAFHHPEAAAEAWRLTEEFLARTLPVS
ncbi:dienelactone hydrolase family protein [Crossiella sp. CA198]|uniref:dienelactone hydrolase family protein n=1 Tax=Crossiella sp. CA198 TaxID=3455607 RepID=UPI003F8D7B09